MSYGTCHTFSPVVFLDPLAPSVLLHRIRGFQRTSNSENLLQQQPVFISSLRVFLFVFDALHTVISSVLVHTLPTAQVTSAFTDSFSMGHDPFAHACKARPLTIVGWTSLSVSLSLLLRWRDRGRRSWVKDEEGGRRRREEGGEGEGGKEEGGEEEGGRKKRVRERRERRERKGLLASGGLLKLIIGFAGATATPQHPQHFVWCVPCVTLLQSKTTGSSMFPTKCRVFVHLSITRSRCKRRRSTHTLIHHQWWRYAQELHSLLFSHLNWCRRPCLKNAWQCLAWPLSRCACRLLLGLLGSIGVSGCDGCCGVMLSLLCVTRESRSDSSFRPCQR